MFRRYMRLYDRCVRKLGVLGNRLRASAARIPVARAHGIFEWKWGVSFFSALALAMIGIGLSVEPFEYLFTLARLFIILAFVCALLWWLTSNQLARRKPRLTRQQRRHGGKPSYGRYWLLKWGVASLLAVSFTFALAITGKIELGRKLELSHGWLVPANDPTPKNACPNLPEGALRVVLGPLAAFGTIFPQHVIMINHNVALSFNRNAQGHIAITTDIYDQDGNIAVEIKNNHFTVSNDAFEISRPDLSTLRVVIKYHKEQVLDVHYLNPTTISVLGIFRSPGEPTLEVARKRVVFNGHAVPRLDICVGNFKGADFVFSTRS